MDVQACEPLVMVVESVMGRFMTPVPSVKTQWSW